jgi:DNA polymerase III delta subunit
MIIAFSGPEKFRKEESIEKAVCDFLGSAAHDDQARVNLFGGDATSGESLIQKLSNACESPSLFAPKQAVILWHLERTSVKDQTELCSYLKSMNPDAGLFIEYEKLDGRTELSKILKKLGQVHEFKALKDYETPKWIQSHARTIFNRNISPDTAQYLWELLGNDLNIIDMELRKLESYAPAKKEFTFDDIHKTVTSQRSASPFELQKAFGMRDMRSFVPLLRNLWRIDTPNFLIIQYLYSHTVNLIHTQHYLTQKMAPKDIALALGIHPFVFSNIQQIDKQAKKKPEALLKRILMRLADLDYECKRGGHSKIHELELALAPMV